MTYQLVVIPGDGIGREVVEATTSVVRDIAEALGVDLTEYDWGASATSNSGR